MPERDKSRKAVELKEMADEPQEERLPFPETGLSPALQRTIKEKLERGELDEVDADVFEENLRRALKKGD